MTFAFMAAYSASVMAPFSLSSCKIDLAPLNANGTVTRVGNKNRSWSQGTVDILVDNAADLDRALDVIRAAALEACALPEIAEVLLREPAILGVEGIDASGTAVRVSVRTKPGQQGPVLREIRLAVKRHLDSEGISVQPPA